MIHISHELVSEIRLESEKAYPNECCGFIFGKIRGREKFAEEIKAAVNSSDETEKFHRFEITPEEMLKAERFARSIKADIVGFYHSHPDHPAVPSEYDTIHALPIYSYIISSVINGKTEDLQSWELDEKMNYWKFTSENISE